MNYFAINMLMNKFAQINSTNPTNLIKTNSCDKLDKKKIPVHIIGNGWASYHFAKNLNKNLYEPIIIAPNLKVLDTTKLIDYIFDDNLDLYFENNYGKIICGNLIDFDSETNELKIEQVEQIKRVSNKKIKYEYLVLAIGSESNDFEINGIEENTLKLKTKEDAEKIRYKLIEQYLKNFHLNSPGIKLSNELAINHIYIIGSGITGIELACALGKKLNNQMKNSSLIYSIKVIEGMDKILPGYNLTTQNLIEKTLINSTNNIKFDLGKFVASIDSQNINFAHTSKSLPINYSKSSDIIIWTSGVRINGYKKTKLFDTMNKISQNHTNKIIRPRGIEVDDFFHLGNLSNVYCLGDMVANKGPTSAQNARLQAEWLAKYFNNKFVSNKKFESNINIKLIHLANSIYVESKYYSGFLPKIFGEIISLFYK